MDSALGQRAKVGSRTFLRAGAGVTASVLDDGNAKYTPGVSELRSGTTAFSHSGLKSMAAQTDAAATPAVQATRIYDAFGGVQASTGSWQGPFGTAGAFGYQTEASALHLLGHRYYDATLGRFLSRDQKYFDGGYVYCDSAPLDYYDDGGEDKVIVHSNPGGIGMGSHAYVGFEDGSGHRKWYSFYPNPPGAGGGSSGKGRGSGKGPGHVSLLPPPGKAGSKEVEFDVTPDQRRRFRRVIATDIHQRENRLENPRPYSVRHFNCVDWIVLMLRDGGIEQDYRVDIWQDKVSAASTPRDLLQWFEGFRD